MGCMRLGGVWQCGMCSCEARGSVAHAARRGVATWPCDCKAHIAGRGTATGCIRLGGVWGTANWGSISGKAKATKSVDEGKEITHQTLKMPNAKQDLVIEKYMQSSL